MRGPGHRPRLRAVVLQDPQGLHADGLLPLRDRCDSGARIRTGAGRISGRPAARAQPESVGHLMAAHTFDAIVVGSGMSGGWAAKELTEKGLKTLVLERGRDVKHLADYPTTNMNPWEFEHRNQLTEQIQKENPVVSKCYAFREDAM